MIKIFFNDGEVREADFERISDHVVSVSGDINVSGFLTAKLDGSILGNFSDFRHIYRTVDGSVQYCDDGAVWTDPVPEPPDTEPSSYDVLTQKVEEMYSDYDKLDAVSKIVTICTKQSDKLGYDWEIIKIGDIEVQKKYVANPDAKGTQSNPFTDDSVMIDNAYYIIDGIKYVCMGGQLVDFEW